MLTLLKALNRKLICITIIAPLQITLQLNYSFAVEFTVRSNTTPDCLQFCRPCVAKAARLLQIPVDIYRATLKITPVQIFCLILSPNNE